MALPRVRLQGAGAGLAGPPFTLFYLSLADSALPVRVVNTRILVAGSSPTALAVTEHLATRYFSLYLCNARFLHCTYLRISLHQEAPLLPQPAATHPGMSCHAGLF